MKALRTLAVLLLGTTAALAVWARLELRSPGTALAYTVTRCSDTPSCVLVVTRIDEPVRPFLDLYVRDNRNPDSGRPRILGMSAMAGEQVLQVSYPYFFTRDVIRLWTGLRQPASVTLTLKLDATWKKGQSVLSYLGSDLGVLRPLMILPSPLGAQAALLPGYLRWLASVPAEPPEVNFDLAPLTSVLPLKDGAASCDGPGRARLDLDHLLGSYVPVGRFSHRRTAAEDMTIHLCVPEEFRSEGDTRYADQIGRVLAHERRLTGWTPPATGGVVWVTLMPDEVTRGGAAAGLNSVITGTDATLMAHETLHWWIGQGVRFAPEAGWFEEGLNDYYARKIAVQAGLLPPEEQRRRMVRNDAELTAMFPGRKVNLTAASRAGRFVPAYRGGLAVALWLEITVAAETGGKLGLDDLLRQVLNPGRKVNNRQILKALRDLGTHGAADGLRAMLDGRAPIPYVEQMWPVPGQLPWQR